MSSKRKGNKMGLTKRRTLNKEKAKSEAEEIKTLQRLIEEQAPETGSNPLLELMAKEAEDKKNPKTKKKGKKTSEKVEEGGEGGEEEGVPDSKTNLTSKKFSELPLSSKTLGALASNGWDRLTHVQAASLPHSLVGRDILGAAKTGPIPLFLFLLVLC
jgi:hypothetical protein